MRHTVENQQYGAFLFTRFPHPFPIAPLRGKLNFASETEENKRLTNSIFRFLERTRNNFKTNVYGKRTQPNDYNGSGPVSRVEAQLSLQDDDALRNPLLQAGRQAVLLRQGRPRRMDETDTGTVAGRNRQRGIPLSGITRERRLNRKRIKSAGRWPTGWKASARGWPDASRRMTVCLSPQPFSGA